MNHPTVPLQKLDELWFQITGTQCNLTCSHCFISCSPDNTSFGNLSYEEVAEVLEDSTQHGVKEYYFTGGEPFLHPRIIEVLSLALQYGPVTVLTNGHVMTPKLVDQLVQAEKQSLYSLEFRVSVDHFDEAKNDAIRGDKAFSRALRGIARLAKGGFLPIVTAMRTCELDEDLEVLDEFSELLRQAGVDRPRIKILPSLKLGAEAQRSEAYEPCDYVTQDMMEGFPVEQFTCSHSRIVTDRGVHVCPILIESDDSILGKTVGEALDGYELKHQACSTCYAFGAFCINPSSVLTDLQTIPSSTAVKPAVA